MEGELNHTRAQQIIDVARLYAKEPAGSILYCMGITQHTSGVDNVKSLANLAMLCGNLGIRGGGVNPLRGQNNVQGACDMGGLPNVLSGYQTVDNLDAIKKMERAWNVTGLPTKPGLKVTEMLPKAHDGEFKAMYIIGENPMVSDADLNHAEDCFKHLEFLVVQDIFLTETAWHADVVLPASAWPEKDGTVTNTNRQVQMGRPAVPPPPAVRTRWRTAPRWRRNRARRAGHPCRRAAIEWGRGGRPSASRSRRFHSSASCPSRRRTRWNSAVASSIRNQWKACAAVTASTDASGRPVASALPAPLVMSDALTSNRPHQQACRLVDSHQVLILVDHFQRLLVRLGGIARKHTGNLHKLRPARKHFNAHGCIR